MIQHRHTYMLSAIWISSFPLVLYITPRAAGATVAGRILMYMKACRITVHALLQTNEDRVLTIVA